MITAHRVAVAGLTVALAVALAGCGDDDDSAGTTTRRSTTTAGDEAFCAAVDDLDQDVDALVDTDVRGEGTNAVDARLTAIRRDVAAIREAAPDAAPQEADAFDRDLEALNDAVAALDDEPLTTASARRVVSAVTSAVETGLDYLDALHDACP